MSVPRLLVAAFATIGTAAFAQFPGSQPPPSQYKVGFDSITTQQAIGYLSYLAGPETQGRGTGQPGFQKAADFVAARFKEFGLKPMGDHGTYFQGVPFWRSYFQDQGSFLRAVGTGKTIDGGKGFRLSSASGPVNTSTVVVEIPEAVNAAQVDPALLANHIIVLLGDKPTTSMRALFRSGAVAIFSVRPSLPMIEYSIRRSAPAEGQPRSIAFGTVTDHAWKDLQSSLAWRDVPANAGVRVSANSVRMVANVKSEDVSAPNVVGLLEGTDPTLKAEVVGIGAHLDHLGISGGRVYPGADDDGSGSTALLEVAHAFSVNPVRPKRSILFMEFCGEELGLIGSSYYAAHPVFPHEKMISELQMDMVGRRSDGPQNGDPNRVDKADENIDTIRLVGSKRISTDLDKIIEEANKSVNFRFKYDAEDVYTRSDHYNFARNGIPIAFLFTGFHPDYHQPTDTIEKIDFVKIMNSAKLYYLTANLLANNPDRPVKDVPQGR